MDRPGRRTEVEMVMVNPVLDAFYDLEMNKWKFKGACRGYNADAWFPKRGASTRAAKSICRQCDVQVECLEYAVNMGEKHGIWGGLSERERRAIRKKRGITFTRENSNKELAKLSQAIMKNRR